MKVTLKNFGKTALIAGAALSAFTYAVPASYAQDKTAFTEEQKAALQEMFKEYLMNNGEVVVNAVEEFRRVEELKAQQSAQENLKLHQEYFATKTLPTLGNPDGDVTVVEFFDYNCGYCKRAYEDIMKLIGEDKNVRVVLMEMPILSPTSTAMAEISHAAHKQGKYPEIHAAFMNYRGQQTPEALLEVAKGLGLDMEKLEKDRASSELKVELDKSMKIARELGIRGTPGFVIGDAIYPGYIGLEGLKSSIADARAAKGKAQ